MNENSASSVAFRFPADSIPVSATTTSSAIPCRFCKASRTGMIVFVSAVLHSKGAPRAGTRTDRRGALPGPTCRRSVPSHPDLTQVVLIGDFEVQRRDHGPEASGAGGELGQDRGDLRPVVPGPAASQRPIPWQGAPTSVKTRRLSAFEVGSTIVAELSCGTPRCPEHQVPQGNTSPSQPARQQ
jgi:hypothetical protein